MVIKGFEHGAWVLRCAVLLLFDSTSLTQGPESRVSHDAETDEMLLGRNGDTGRRILLSMSHSSESS